MRNAAPVSRRSVLRAGAGFATLCAVPHAGVLAQTKAHVVVIGGGYGGATAAKYVRLLSDGKINVTLIEPDAQFVSCPLSNLVLGGSKQMSDITRPYETLANHHGVRVIRDRATAIDVNARRVTLANGAALNYDKLVVSPGVEMLLGEVEGMDKAQAAGQVVSAWKAGPETALLRRQLEAMPDGGVFAVAIPEVPYRCPPGPYERACQVAWYFKKHKPRSKVLILDANPDVTSKGDLFKAVWAGQYKGIVEYRSQYKAVGVDGATRTAKFEVQDDVKADVLNVIAPQRAGAIAVQAGLNTLGNNRWCGVDYLTFESTVARDVHVLGDSIQIAPGMPKSGHMANNHGKVAAAAIVARLSGWDVDPAPMLANTCYSFVDDTSVVHVASVHQYSAEDKTYHTIPGSGGLSPAPNAAEGRYAFSWANNIWSDLLD